jgi:hypothetical protein
MPKLLPDPDNFSVTKPVTTAVSAADVASPYMAMAHVLDKSGEGLNEFAMAQAKKAGEEAGLKARVDDNGQIVMDPAPFLVGPAMPEYRRAATMSAAIRMQPQIETKMLEMRLEDPDPQVFQRKATAYGQDLVRNISDPALKVGITKMVSESGAHNYRTALVEADKKNVADAYQNYMDQIEQNNNQKELIARQGGGPTKENPQGSDEYRGREGSNMQLVEELVGDKRFGVTRSQGDDLLKNSIDRDRIQGVIGEVVRKYKSKANVVEAQRELEDRFLTGPEARELGLGAKKGEAAVGEGLRALERTSAVDRQQVSEFRTAVNKWMHTSQERPGSYDEGTYQALRKQADDLNDPKTKFELDAFPAWFDTAKHFEAGSLPERIRIAGQLNRMRHPDFSGGAGAGITPPPGGDYSAPGQIDRSIIAKELQEKPGLADRLNQMVRGEVGPKASDEVRRIQMETAMNRALARGHSLEQALWDTGAHGDNGYYPPTTFSRGGYSDEVFKGDLEAVLAGSNYAGKHSGGHLITGNASDEPGNPLASKQFKKGMPGFTLETGVGPESYFSEGPFKVKVGGGAVGKPIDFSNPADARLWAVTQEAVEKKIAASAVKLHGDLDAQIKAGVYPKADDVSMFLQLAGMSGKQDLIDKLKTDLEPLEVERNIPPEQRVATRAALESAKQTAPAAQFLLAQKVQQRLDASIEQSEKNPLIRSSTFYGTPPPGPLSPSMPEAAVAGEFAQREKSMGLFNENEHTVGRPINVFGEEEAKQIASALVNSDPKQAATFLNAMRSQLSEPNYVATMSSPPMRDAVVGMVNSNDPTRFVTGMNTLSDMWQNHHPEVGRIYGEHSRSAIDTMLAWRGQGAPQGGTTPQDQQRLAQFIDRAHRAYDPAFAKERETAETAIETERSKWSPEDVAYRLGTGFRVTGGITGATPNIPPDNWVAAGMKNEFFDFYKAQRMFGTNPDQAESIAIDQMKKSWAPSVIGNVLMKNPPDISYPPIDGSHQWLKDAIREKLTTELGPQFTEVEGGVAFPEGQTFGQILRPTESGFFGFLRPGPQPNWKFKGLAADDKTERQVRAGEKPTYQIWYTDARGFDQILVAKDGSNRFGWDAAAYMKAAGERAKERIERGNRARDIYQGLHPDELGVK